jgi:hypothetical protein
VLRERLQGEDVALVTMVHSHFNHVSMAPESANPVAAKILYARDGSWVYIIAGKPGGTVRAIARTMAATTDLGVLTEYRRNGNAPRASARAHRIDYLAARRYERCFG